MNKLGYWRGKRKLTLKQLGEKSSVAYAAISRIENGRTRPRTLTLEKLAAALEIDLSELAEINEIDRTQPFRNNTVNTFDFSPVPVEESIPVKKANPKPRVRKYRHGTGALDAYVQELIERNERNARNELDAT